MQTKKRGRRWESYYLLTSKTPLYDYTKYQTKMATSRVEEQTAEYKDVFKLWLINLWRLLPKHSLLTIVKIRGSDATCSHGNKRPHRNRMITQEKASCIMVTCSETDA